MPDGASTSHLLKPKLATTLGGGYGLASLRADIAAGMTVAVVALPLSMAIAVASGVAPERGLYAAVVGGFFVSALGGSRVQIGGPAGAFIVLVAAAAAQLGLAGLATAIALSGLMLMVLGVLRIGSLVRYIPHAVTVSFTGAIAVVIAAGQIKDFAGLTLHAPDPAALTAKLLVLGAAIPTASPYALLVGSGVVATVLMGRRLKATWPWMLVAIAGAALAVALFRLPVATVHDRFGAMPRGLPPLALPRFDFASVARAFPAAVSFTILGAIESLLSAKVADSMTGRHHRSNMELIAQGVANIASACFGGICVTGTIARTATNIRAGATSPVAGILHSAFLLAFLVVAAPLAGFIPLSALAGVLLVVCWDMAERRELGRLLRQWPMILVVVATMGVTFARDLISGIAAGCLVSAAFALWRFRAQAAAAGRDPEAGAGG